MRRREWPHYAEEGVDQYAVGPVEALRQKIAVGALRDILQN